MTKIEKYDIYLRELYKQVKNKLPEPSIFRFVSEYDEKFKYALKFLQYNNINVENEWLIQIAHSAVEEYYKKASLEELKKDNDGKEKFLFEFLSNVFLPEIEEFHRARIELQQQSGRKLS